MMVLDEVEDRVVSGLRDRIADREAIEIFVRAYNDERKRLAADSINRRARVERQLAMAEREYERVYRSYVKGFIEEDELDRELPTLKAERARLRRELAACDEPPRIISLHPATVKRYLGSIDTLAKTIAGGDIYGAGSKAALRDLVKTVTVYKADKGQQPDIEVIGKLTALIGGNHFPSVPPPGGTSGSGRGT
jgi:site-specific DNA recombinase